MLILAIVIPVLVVLAAVVLIVTARNSDARSAVGALSKETRTKDAGSPLTESAAAASTGREVELAAAADRKASTALAVRASVPPPAPWIPPDDDTLGVTRRQFFNRSITVLFAFGLSAFGAAVVAFLWPKLSGGFGSKITIGRTQDVIDNIRAGDGFYYLPEGRSWITEFPSEGLEKAETAYPAPVYQGMAAGFVALWQVCPHLGCRVPECKTSQWFECPCHGSQYNRVGEKKGGPAPRGMDHFAIAVNNGLVVVDTGSRFEGAPIGTNTTGQEAEGPHCITSGGGH
jgi:cytochrome b6-f complex iron-sulfur subunit